MKNLTQSAKHTLLKCLALFALGLALPSQAQIQVQGQAPSQTGTIIKSALPPVGISCIICASVCFLWRLISDSLAGARTSPRRGRPRFFAADTLTVGCATTASAGIKSPCASGPHPPCLNLGARALQWLFRRD